MQSTESKGEFKSFFEQMMANMDNLDTMTDEQLQMAIDEMKKNKPLAKQAFNNRPGGGRQVDDAQLDSICNMMTPDMMRQSIAFAKANPGMLQNQLKDEQPIQQQGFAKSYEEAKD